MEQAIAIRVDLGPALIAIGSYLAPEVEENYIQAKKLCERLGGSAQLFPLLWTLSRIRHWRGELLAARQLAEQLLYLARREQDSLRLVEAHHTLWAISLDMGELASTKRYADQGFMLYDRVRHGRVLTRQTSERPKSYYRDWGLRAQDNVAFQFFVYE